MKTRKNLLQKNVSRKHLKSKRKSKHKKRGGGFFNGLFGTIFKKKEEAVVANNIKSSQTPTPPNKPAL